VRPGAARPDEDAEDDWRTYYEGVGDGVTLCPEYLKRVFGHDRA
jgi:hypothetical protein